MKGFFYISFGISKLEQEASLSREWRLIQHFKVDTSTVNLCLSLRRAARVEQESGKCELFGQLLGASDGSSKFSESRFLTLDTATTVLFDRLMASSLTLHSDLTVEVKYKGDPKSFMSFQVCNFQVIRKSAGLFSDTPG